MDSIGWQEIFLVLVVALLVYGERLPQAARKVGIKYAELKKKWQDIQMDIKREIDAAAKETDIKKDIDKAVGDADMDKPLDGSGKQPGNQSTL